MKKKFLSLLLALAMCLSLSVPAWAEVLEPSFDAKYNTLLSNGFPESFLNALDEYCIDYLYNKSQEYYLVYGEASATPMNGADSVAPYATGNSGIAPTSVTDGDFTMTSSRVIAYAENRVDVDHYTIFVNYEWTDAAAFCLKDGFVSNWPQAHLTYISGSFSYRPYYKTESATSWTLDTASRITQSDPEVLLQGGLGVLFNLKASSAQTYLHKGTFFYDLNKVIPTSGGINVTVNSSYAHKCAIVDTQITLGPDGYSVTFIPGNYYELQSSAVSFQL